MFRRWHTIRVSCGSSILIAAFVMMVVSPSTQAATSLSGIIKDKTGSPVSGALVKVSGSETGLSFMVVSQADGRYETPELLPGEYTVQAIGGTNQSDVVNHVPVRDNRQVKADMVLSVTRVIPPPAKKMANSDYELLMPAGEGKDQIASRCVMCHGLDRVVPARKTPEAWQITLTRMAYFLEARPDLGGPLSNVDKKSVLDYLSKNFNRETQRLPEPAVSDPNQHLPARLLEGAETRFVVMEFDTGNDSERNEFGVDSKGNAWITEGATSFFGKFDPNSLSYTRIEAPADKFPRSLSQIAVDPQDHVWILDNGSAPNSELLRYDPQNKEFKAFPVPLPQESPKGFLAVLNTMRFLNGNVWGTGNVSSRVVKLDPRTGKITEYPAPRGSHPYGIAIGGDKAVWYITNYKNEIIRLDPDTGIQTPHLAPTPKSGLRRMGADALGNLWAGAQDSNKLVKLEISTGKVTEFAVPTKDAGPYSVDVDTKNNLVWFSERDGDKLGRYNPDTGAFIEFPLLTAGIEARRILVDPVNPNRIWWGCASSIDRFGYLEIIE